MEPSSQLDVLVDDLLSHTQSLLEAPKNSPSPLLNALLDERGRAARMLHQEAYATGLTPGQRSRLQTAIHLGDNVRLPMTARRETLRNRLQEVRNSRRVRDSLKPYRQTRGRRLNVSL